ncbi:MAG: 5'-methylthioadenosine/S-adenosylhomocysteine nucleosidase [Anaerolineae bacterium]|nr:5'-methylthioadenosine/S-adenosylhomocysteine nucleosidase [Anaerolineae bacterium]
MNARHAHVRVVVVISATAEWRVVCAQFPGVAPQPSPLGEWFVAEMEIAGRREPLCFFHGGWGKIAAAASAQYVIDRWRPAIVVNLGTCGGFAGEIERGTVVLAERTVVYDIINLMGDYSLAIDAYMTDLDLGWLPDEYPHDVWQGTLVSADRDLLPDDLPALKETFGAAAGDWESGAIAWTAARNGVRCLILRAVTDLVSTEGGEAYGDMAVFEAQTQKVMPELLAHLPAWLAEAL